MNKQIFLGIGTGRCGTVSLYKLLSHQPGVYCTHEHPPLLPWCPTKELFEEQAKRLERALDKGYLYAGDVAFYWLPYLEWAVERWANLKVIVLWRDVNEVVESFMRKTKKRNHWIDHDGTIWKKDPIWDPCFPKWDSTWQGYEVSKRMAIRIYHRNYYLDAKYWIEREDIRALWVDVRDLNTREGQLQIFKFLGLRDYAFLLPCHYNASDGG